MVYNKQIYFTFLLKINLNNLLLLLLFTCTLNKVYTQDEIDKPILLEFGSSMAIPIPLTITSYNDNVTYQPSVFLGLGVRIGNKRYLTLNGSYGKSFLDFKDTRPSLQVDGSIRNRTFKSEMIRFFITSLGLSYQFIFFEDSNFSIGLHRVWIHKETKRRAIGDRFTQVGDLYNGINLSTKPKHIKLTFRYDTMLAAYLYAGIGFELSNLMIELPEEESREIIGFISPTVHLIYRF